MSSPHPASLTPLQYLEIERRAEIKSESIAGHMYAMSGGSRRHNLIALNIGRELSLQMRNRGCEAYVNDMRVKIDPSGSTPILMSRLFAANRISKTLISIR
jgi:Uma2 family endonuclease